MFDLKKETETRKSDGEGYDFLKLRKTYGLTQSDLGNLLRVSKNYICQIETGRKVPSGTLVALAERIERELAEASTSAREMSSGSSGASRRAAVDYLDQVWKASGEDTNLQGYIMTQLKLTFPLDKPPFNQAG